MKEKAYGRSTGFVALLQVAFIVLKLTKVIGWSWGWVLAPMWMSAILTLVLVLILCVAAVAKNKS